MGSDRDIEPSSEDLDGSMTQAPLALFIPYNLAVALGAGTFAAGTFFQTWKFFLVGPVLWALAAVWVKRDPKAINVLHVKLYLLRVWFTASPWGGWSVNPPTHNRQEKNDAT